MKLIMGIGIPASGKSTTLKRFAEQYGYSFVSVDEIRDTLGLRPHEPSTETVGRLMREQVRDFLAQKKTVVVDATFFRPEDRREFSTIARECGAGKTQGVFIDLPEDIAWQRNQARERVVPEDVFKKRVEAIKSFPPGVMDGLDVMFTLDKNQEIVRVEMQREGEVVRRDLGKLR